MPAYEYLHPVGIMERKVTGKLDAGAHAYVAPTGVAMDTPPAVIPLRIYPNPLHTSAAVMVTGAVRNSSLVIYNMRGEELRRIPIESNGTATITVRELPCGIYYGMMIGKDNSLIATGPIIVE
jgi:hypothetical protein